MSYIAGYGLNIVSGKIGRGGEKVVDISRDGVDGHAYTLKGLKARSSEIITERDFDSALLANSQILLYKALQGTIVSVVDEDLVTYTYVMVLGCDPIHTNKTGTMTGGWGTVGTNRTIVRMRWLLQLN